MGVVPVVRPLHHWQPVPVTSASEERVKDLLNALLPLDVHAVVDNGRWKFLGGLELDRYYPDIRLAIEINGSKWHKPGDEKDRRKVDACALANIRLMQVWVGPNGVSNGALLKLRREVLHYLENKQWGARGVRVARAIKRRKKAQP